MKRLSLAFALFAAAVVFGSPVARAAAASAGWGNTSTTNQAWHVSPNQASATVSGLNGKKRVKTTYDAEDNGVVQVDYRKAGDLVHSATLMPGQSTTYPGAVDSITITPLTPLHDDHGLVVTH